MDSKLWHFHRKWVGFGPLAGDLLPGWRLGFWTRCVCNDWRNDLREIYADELINEAQKKKGEKR